MAALLSLAEPAVRVIRTRVPANRAFWRVIIGGSLLATLTLLLLYRSSGIICVPGMNWCYGTKENNYYAPSRQQDGEKMDDSQPVPEWPVTPSSTTAKQTPLPSPSSTPQPTPGGSNAWQEAILSDLGINPSDLSLGKEQCQDLFPKILKDVERPWENFQGFEHIIDDQITLIQLREGRMKLSIINQKIIIHETNLPSINYRASALATLQSLHDALAATNETFRPIDLVMDMKREVPDVTDPVWAFTRLGRENNIWLMPASNYLFGFNGHAAAKAYKDTIERAAKDSGIISSSHGTRPFIPQPQLADIGPTRESFIADIQAYESTVNFTDKLPLVVGSWPSGQSPQGNLYKAHLDDMLFGQHWGQHTVENDDSSGIDGYGANVDMKKEPARALCQHKYIFWDPSFGTELIDSAALCASVVFKRKAYFHTVYGMLVEADHGFEHNNHKTYKPSKDPVLERWANQAKKMHNGEGLGSLSEQNVIFVREDLHDLPKKAEAVGRMPEFGRSLAQNQAMIYRQRYLTRAAAACLWRQLVRSYGEVYTNIKYDGSNKKELA